MERRTWKNSQSSTLLLLPSPKSETDEISMQRFMNYVEKTLASRPAEANLGGIPSVQNKIRAFLNVKYLKNGNWSNSALEVSAVSLASHTQRDADRLRLVADREQHASVGKDVLLVEVGSLEGSVGVRSGERKDDRRFREEFRCLLQGLVGQSRSEVR